MSPPTDHLLSSLRDAHVSSDARLTRHLDVYVVAALEHESGWLPGTIEDSSEDAALFVTSVASPALQLGDPVTLVLQPHGKLDEHRHRCRISSVGEHRGRRGVHISYVVTLDHPDDLLSLRSRRGPISTVTGGEPPRPGDPGPNSRRDGLLRAERVPMEVALTLKIRISRHVNAHQPESPQTCPNPPSPSSGERSEP